MIARYQAWKLKRFRKRHNGLFPCCVDPANRTVAGFEGEFAFTRCSCGRRHFEVMADKFELLATGAPVG